MMTCVQNWCTSGWDIFLYNHLIALLDRARHWELALKLALGSGSVQLGQLGQSALRSSESMSCF